MLVLLQSGLLSLRVGRGTVKLIIIDFSFYFLQNVEELISWSEDSFFFLFFPPSAICLPCSVCGILVFGWIFSIVPAPSLISFLDFAIIYKTVHSQLIPYQRLPFAIMRSTCHQVVSHLWYLELPFLPTTLAQSQTFLQSSPWFLELPTPVYLGRMRL